MPPEKRTRKSPSAAEKRRREKQAAEAKAPEGAAPAEGEEVQGVLCVPVYDQAGNLQVSVQRVGDIRPTEVPTILETAAKVVRRGMGLDES